MIVERPARVRASIHVPGDKSISHRSLIFNALADGKATVEELLDSEDVRSTAACLAALGVDIEWPAGSSVAHVTGRGLHGLYESEDVLDCGNSGTTMRLLTGLLSGHPLLSILTGDDSLRTRPMARVIAPMRRMGAHVHGRKGDSLAPIVIKGGDLEGMDYATPVASAQVKSAILLAGLYARGQTTVTEPAPSRDHTERMLQAMGARLTADGPAVKVQPAERLSPMSLRVPGDISSAAPWLVLGACHPDAEVIVHSVNTNATRTGLLDILEAMGAEVEVLEQRVTGGEPVADLLVRTARLHSTTVGGAVVPRAIDELPLVALLGCFAEGETIVQDAAELRTKESDRVDAVARTLSRMGARITPRDDGFVVHGPTKLHGARLDGRGDHRIGMLAAIAGSLADGQAHVENDAVAVSYPEFWRDLADAARG